MMREAAHSVFITCRDREAVAPSEDLPTTIMPNGVDVDFWKRAGRELGNDTIAFTGAMDYRPNTDAALYLIEDVLPLVRRSIPDAKLLLVGRDPTPGLVRAGEREGVTVTGFVDDVRPFLERATVFVAPLRFGAGIQNKVLEAMAMEVPVVASELAADGLRTEDGQRPPVAVAVQAEEFADHVVRILRERTGDRTPDVEARRYVETNFVWSASATKLDRVLHLVGGKEPVCSPLP
jgi:glycosyltransferase involved in cell wall biosynthesis